MKKRKKRKERQPTVQEQAAQAFEAAMAEQDRGCGKMFLRDGVGEWDKEAKDWFGVSRQLVRQGEARALIVVPHCNVCGTTGVLATLREGAIAFCMEWHSTVLGERAGFFFIPLGLDTNLVNVLTRLRQVPADWTLPEEVRPTDREVFVVRCAVPDDRLEEFGQELVTACEQVEEDCKG